MAFTIIQRPDSLSFLANLKSIILNNSSEVSLILYKSGSQIPILTETYYPNSFGRIEVDVRDAIKPYLKRQDPDLSQEMWSHTPSTFTVVVDDVIVATFAVINGGVRKMTDSTENFLIRNWLTWQPQSKPVSYYSPEYLSYYFSKEGSVKARFYLLNGGSVDKTVYSCEAGELATMKTSMDHLISKSGYDIEDLQGYIDVWVEDSVGSQMSYIQRYIFQPVEGDEHFYICENSLGGIDTFNFHGALTLIPEVDHQVAEMSSAKVNITDSAVRKWQQNTGYLNSLHGVWLWEFLSASAQWTLSGGVMESIVLDTSDMSVKDKDNLHACSFKFALAEEGRLLNIDRNSEELPSLTVPSPGSLFFLENRLADYAEAILDDSTLFAVQYPSADKWYKTSLGSIKGWILGIITDSDLGTLAHLHENKDVLDNFTEEDGKPSYKGSSLATTEETENKFLRKDRDDIAHGHITHEDGATFGPSFASGPNGVGGRIDRHGNGELHSLRIRTWLEASEFRFNRVAVEAGNSWRAPGGGLIESVVIDTDAAGDQLMSGVITLKLEEGEIGTVAVDDICMGIFHNEIDTSQNSSETADDGYGNFQFAGFSTVYFRITEILDGRNQIFRYQLRGTDERWTQINHPKQAMTFVGYGNFSDKTRQSSRYSTRTYERYLTGVSTWEFSIGNIAAQFGDLSNLEIFGMQMSGYSAFLNNIYMSGTIKQFENLSLRLDINTDGDSFIAYGETKHISCTLWRGFEDVTSQVTSWSIVRDSGDAADDAAWALKEKVKQFAGELDICFTVEESDIASNEYTISTLFTITATIDSESAVNILTI